MRGLAGPRVSRIPEAASGVDPSRRSPRSISGPAAPRPARSRSPGGGRRRRRGTWRGSPRRALAGGRRAIVRARHSQARARCPRDRGSSPSRRRPRAGRPARLPACAAAPKLRPSSAISSSSGGRRLPEVSPPPMPKSSIGEPRRPPDRPAGGPRPRGRRTSGGWFRKAKLHGPDRPVAVLGDDQFRHPGLIGLVLVVVLVAVEEARPGRRPARSSCGQTMSSATKLW